MNSAIVIHPFKTADWQSKARNKEIFKTRERLQTFCCVGVMYCTQVNKMLVMLLCMSVYPYRARLKNMPGIFFKLARCGYTLRVTSQASTNLLRLIRWLYW
jgi:hypothetical protein